MAKPRSLELPAGAQLVYIAEGGANIIYRIVSPPNSRMGTKLGSCVPSSKDHQTVPAEFKGKLLRLRKDTPAGVSYQEIARNFDKNIRPLFRPEELVDQELIYLPKGLVQRCNEQLRAAELTGNRPKQRRGLFLSVTEPFGLLVTDMTHLGNPGADVAELKPKWLLQSPSAPSGARRCRTCALRDMKNHDSRRVGAIETRSFCPLDLVSDKFEHVLRATRFVKGQKDHIRLARVLHRNSTLLKLLAHQRSLRDVGNYGPSPYSRDKSLAMTLRDCTMYIKIPRNESGRVEIRLGDLDLKTAGGGKAQYWLDLEHRLITDGWYVGARGDSHPCECALQCSLPQSPPSM
ncbi:inositol-pentakisphosphate 2-kinase [Aspergillus lucknowensis]|uniref:Inositol-pentakisphosphate 2-kinase n=1 Tax=Aspergillus lucknowensis TaxID=176173 RepID=A0ABR4M117_9EURO